jgi:hypothetical protein
MQPASPVRCWIAPPVLMDRASRDLLRCMTPAPVAVLFRSQGFFGFPERLDFRHAKFAVFLVGEFL